MSPIYFKESTSKERPGDVLKSFAKESDKYKVTFGEVREKLTPGFQGLWKDEQTGLKNMKEFFLLCLERNLMVSYMFG